MYKYIVYILETCPDNKVGIFDLDEKSFILSKDYFNKYVRNFMELSLTTPWPSFVHFSSDRFVYVCNSDTLASLESYFTRKGFSVEAIVDYDG